MAKNSSFWPGKALCGILILCVIAFVFWWLVKSPHDHNMYGKTESFVEHDDHHPSKFTEFERVRERVKEYVETQTEQTTNDDPKENPKCRIEEEVRALQNRMMNPTEIELNVPRNNDLKGGSKDDFSKFDLIFIWSKPVSESQTASGGSAKLRIFVYYTYMLAGVMYTDVRPMTTTVAMSGTKPTYVPVPCDVIDRERANSAKIVRLLVEFADSAASQCNMGIEKIAVSEFNSKNYNDPIAPQKRTIANNERGRRVDYGVLQVDPIVLVSNGSVQSCNKDTGLGLPNAQAIIGDVVYGGYRMPYPLNSTKTYRMRICFTGDVPRTCNLYFFQIDYNQDNENHSLANITEKGHFWLSNYFETNFQNVASLGDLPTDTRVDNNTFRRENVTCIHLSKLRANEIKEFTFACADPRSTQGLCTNAFMVSGNGFTVSQLELVPESVSNKNGAPDDAYPLPFVTITNTRLPALNDNMLLVLDRGNLYKSVLKPRQFPIFADYVVDADASIIRLNQVPGKDELPCQTSFSSPLIVNDGWMFAGTLRLPLVKPMVNSNQLLKIKLKLGCSASADASIEFEITRTGAYLSVNDQPVGNATMRLTANVVRWLVYVYKGTYCISLNLQQPVKKGSSPKLSSLYSTTGYTGPASGKEKQNPAPGGVSTEAYPPIQSMEILVDPEIVMQSRFVSAIGYIPQDVDLQLHRDDSRKIMYPRPVYAWRADAPGSTSGYSYGFGSDTSDTLDLSNSVTDSISWQIELTRSRLIEQLRGSTNSQLYTNSECNLIQMSTGDATHGSIVTVYLQSTGNKNPTLFDIMVRFDGCHAGKSNPPNHTLGDETLFSEASTSLANQRLEDERVIIKYTLHKLTERICLFTKAGQEVAKLKESYTHQISPDFNLQDKLKTFPLVTLKKQLLSSFVCADRASSSMCNPYVKDPHDKKQNECEGKRPRVTGQDTGNPNKGLTDFPCHTSVNRAMDAVYANQQCQNYTTSDLIDGNDSDEANARLCAEQAKAKYPNGTFSYVSPHGRTATDGSGNKQNCFYGKGPCALNENVDGAYTFSFYQNCDVVQDMSDTYSKKAEPPKSNYDYLVIPSARQQSMFR